MWSGKSTVSARRGSSSESYAEYSTILSGHISSYLPENLPSPVRKSSHVIASLVWQDPCDSKYFFSLDAHHTTLVWNFNLYQSNYNQQTFQPEYTWLTNLGILKMESSPCKLFKYALFPLRPRKDLKSRQSFICIQSYETRKKCLQKAQKCRTVNTITA